MSEYFHAEVEDEFSEGAEGVEYEPSDHSRGSPESENPITTPNEPR